MPAALTPELLFTGLNLAVLPFWLLLLLLPHTRLTDFLVHSVFAPVALGVVYAWLFAEALSGPGLPEGAGFSNLGEVMTAFTSPQLFVAAWVHYLVFDLFAGAWQARDAQRLGLSHFALIPCLLLTFLVGPVGLLFWLLIRGLAGNGGWSLFES